MSWQAVSYAERVLEEDDELRLGARLVFMVLAAQASRTGAAWPSAATIARKCRMDASSVRRSISQIVAAGYITVDRREGTSNVYRFPLATPIAVAADELSTPRAEGRGVHDSDRAPTGAGDRADGRGGSRRRARRTSHEPVMNHATSSWCDNSCVWCDGTGFESDPDTNTSTPCRARSRSVG